ncbi:F0F1 ATP synthase subunit delta [Marinimicrobium agarilyticum]|uniref:F0F1 ATP synthase subunit delta n=1 Tax=Marinimicrobium agarilyticum TaxID=306546 RepID=UPI0003FBDBBE|nr:F0F1 ATP synthase subunit delta [Marinimicrobium agarilyticum]
MAELTTLARPYAKAAFQYALDAQDLSGWARQLATLAGASQYGAMVEVIASPSRSADQQAKALIDACGDELSEPVRNYVQLLAQNKRLILLPEIHELFEALKHLQEQSVEVELTTAFELADADQENLAKALEEKLKRKVSVRAEVDQELLAGVIVKAGDLVIDGSMRGRLEKLAKAINS